MAPKTKFLKPGTNAFEDLETAFEILIETAEEGNFPKEWIIQMVKALDAALQREEFPENIAYALADFLNMAVGECLQDKIELEVAKNIQKKEERISTASPLPMEKPEIKSPKTTRTAGAMSAKTSPTENKTDPETASCKSLEINLIPISGDSSFLPQGSVAWMLINTFCDKNRPIRSENWGESTANELRRLRNKCANATAISVFESGEGMPKMEEDDLYNLTYITGNNISIFVWGTNKICFWQNPEKQKMSETLIEGEIEPEELKSLIVLRQPNIDKLEIQFIKFSR